MRGLLWTLSLTVLAVVAGWMAMRGLRWARKGSKAGSMLAAAAFPFPEQPPPQEQVAQQNRLKKADSSGDPDPG